MEEGGRARTMAMFLLGMGWRLKWGRVEQKQKVVLLFICMIQSLASV